jgi:hypothetical protein
MRVFFAERAARRKARAAGKASDAT